MGKHAGWIIVASLVIALTAVALVLLVWSRRAQPTVAVQTSPAVMALPGDAYIDQTARDYMSAIVKGEPRAIERLRQTAIDPDAVRAETLGRFASAPASALKIDSIHDEQVVSGNGNSQPPTSWSAVVVMEVAQASGVETFGVQLTGSYGANGTLDSSKADASAR